jgi:hypothetical protein
MNDQKVFNLLLDSLENVKIPSKGTLDIPIMFTAKELRRYNVNLIINTKRDLNQSWNDSDSKSLIKNLKWNYPIKAVSVVNAISKTEPFLLECTVRKRLEKRMEIVLTGVTTYSSGIDRAIKIRSVTPNTQDSSDPTLVVVGDNNIANEFVHSIQYTGGLDQNEIVRNSIAIKLIRSNRDKTTGLVTLVFNVIFCPSKSFM